MKEVAKFLDEIAKREYDSAEKASKAEERSREIMEAFSFYDEPADPLCKFGNGEWSIQRTKDFYGWIQDGIIRLVNKQEPRIAEQFEKHGGLSRENVKGGYIIGRYLDDWKSPLYKWWGILYNICPKCFREYGQPYYAINCKCEKSTIPVKEE